MKIQAGLHKQKTLTVVLSDVNEKFQVAKRVYIPSSAAITTNTRKPAL